MMMISVSKLTVFPLYFSFVFLLNVLGRGWLLKLDVSGAQF